MKRIIFLFTAVFLSGIAGDFFVLAQEAIPAAAKSDILRYREQQDIFSEDLHGLGYIEAARVLNDETSSEKKILYYFRQGKDYFNSFQYEKALTEFKAALEWGPKYKPALKYVELIEEKLRQKQQVKDKQELAQRKMEEEAERRKDKEDARLNKKERLKYEQNIKQQQEYYKNSKKINEVKVKDLLNARIKQYESDKKAQKELERRQEKIKAENIKLEIAARLKAEKEQAEMFRKEKLSKEKNIQRRNLEEQKRREELQRQKDLQSRMAAEEILLSEKEKAKQEQFIKLEMEKSRNLKNLNEARFRDELKEKLKQENLIKHSSAELTPAVKGGFLPEVAGVNPKEYITGNLVPDNLELSNMKQEFENKYSEALREKDRIKKDYNKLLEQANSMLSDSNRVKELELSMERHNSELQLFKRENENLKKDYNGLLSQVKELLVYRKKLEDLNGLLEKVMLDKNLFEKEKEIFKLENVELKNKVQSLQEAQDKITKDANRYKGAYEKLYSEAVVKELKIKAFAGEAPALEKKNKEIESELKRLNDENKKIKKDYESALAQLKELMLDSRRAKESENSLIRSKAQAASLAKERDTLKSDRSRVLSQMKGLLEDRRRVKKLESLLEESKADIKVVQKENEITRKDYNNLLMQIKLSIVDKKHLKELEGILEKNKADMSLMAKDSEAVKAQNAGLKGKIKQFEEEQIKLAKERDTYKIADSAVKELKAAISGLEKEKSGLLAQLKQAQKENEVIKKNYEELLAQVNDLLLDKNRLKELGDIIEKNKTEKSLLEKDNEAVKSESLGLKNRVKELENLQAQLSKARDDYKSAYEKEHGDVVKKELKGEISKLEKEKNDILSELKQAKDDNESVKKENSGLKDKLEKFEAQALEAQTEKNSVTVIKEMKQMQKENELIKKDYASLLAQVKDLLAAGRRVKEMGALLEKDKANMALLEKEKAAAKAENTALKNKVARLEDLERKLAEDKQDGDYGAESGAKKLKIKEFKAEDTGQEPVLLTQPQPDGMQLRELQSKFEEEKKQLSRQADEYKKKYFDELEKNDLAMRRENNLPKKFNDAAKKNEELLKETSGMHYNLGVFFIKNKEYDRAIIEFEKAIELYPDDPYSYYNLGYIYAQYLSDRGKAVKYFRKFLQFVKNDDKDVEWVKDYLLTWEAYK